MRIFSPRATASAPLNTSPAAVVSMAVTRGAGMSAGSRPSYSSAPALSSVMMTVGTPLAKRICAAVSAPAAPVGGGCPGCEFDDGGQGDLQLRQDDIGGFDGGACLFEFGDGEGGVGSGCDDNTVLDLGIDGDEGHAGGGKGIGGDVAAVYAFALQAGEGPGAKYVIARS